MAGRDRTVMVYPSPLGDVIKRYQNDRALPSFNATVIELLESHPAIVQRVQEMYDEAGTEPDERTPAR